MENHRLLQELRHRMDATRLITMAHAFMPEHESPLTNLPDIASYNLYFGWYLGELAQNGSFFDEYHAKYPDRVMGFSEYGADANPQFQASRPEDETEIKVYSNQPEAELTVDGRVIGRKTGSRVFTWRIPITGEHVIAASAGSCTDQKKLRRVAEPNKAYMFRKQEIVNWFDKDEIYFVRLFDTM